MHLNKLFYHNLPWHVGIINNQQSPPAHLCFATVNMGTGSEQYTNDGLT